MQNNDMGTQTYATLENRKFALKAVKNGAFDASIMSGNILSQSVVMEIDPKHSILAY